jgi:L-xylulokinase
MGKYLLSVDNGLTTTKSVIFTLDGKEVASSLVDTVVESLGERAEIDMELQWKYTAGVIRDTVLKSGVNPSDIIGIGNSGHGAGLYCLDRENRPVRKAISSMDARANGILEQWRKEGRSPFERLHQNFWSGQAIPVLNWLKTNEPDSYNRIDKLFMVKDWIIYKLTGTSGLEYPDASNSGLINPVTKEIDRESLEQFGVGEIFERIPALRKTTDIAGYVTKEAEEETGLKAGTPVMGGVFDCISCALGSGVVGNDQYSLIAGTWNVNSGIEDTLIPRGGTIKCSLYTDINRYFYVESSATSAVNLEWFIRNVINGFSPMEGSTREIYGIIDQGVRRICPADSGILYTPFLYESHLAKGLSGSFWGIKPEHNVYHMLRAIFEGVAFAHLKHVENLKKVGIVRNKAVLSGGASKSDLWCQIFADVLGMEIATTESRQGGALGAAICTAVAMSCYRDEKAAVQAMVREKGTYYPNQENNEVYRKKYMEFNKIIELFDNRQ